MKKHLKAILAAALAFTLCAAMSACGNSKSPEDINENDVEQALAGLDKENSSTTSSQSETTPSEEEPEEIVYAPTQEILNADFSSGLIQIGNDVFQQGGYITVAELVEQYSDRYDVTYMQGTYEERKDYLLEYAEEPFHQGAIDKRAGTLVLTPQNENIDKIYVQVANLTSPDEKITLDKAIVLCYAYAEIGNLGSYKTLVYSGYSTSIGKLYKNSPIWLPNGFGFSNTDGLERVNENYTVKSLPEYLTSLGYTGFNSVFSNEWIEAALSGDGVYDNAPYFDSICLYVAGEENLAGYIPIYRYQFDFDKNTDKLSGFHMRIIEMVKK